MPFIRSSSSCTMRAALALAAGAACLYGLVKVCIWSLRAKSRGDDEPSIVPAAIKEANHATVKVSGRAAHPKTSDIPDASFVTSEEHTSARARYYFCLGKQGLGYYKAEQHVPGTQLLRQGDQGLGYYTDTPIAFKHPSGAQMQWRDQWRGASINAQRAAHSNPQRNGQAPPVYGNDAASCPLCGWTFYCGSFHPALQKVYDHMRAHGKKHRKARDKINWDFTIFRPIVRWDGVVETHL